MLDEQLVGDILAGIPADSVRVIAHAVQFAGNPLQSLDLAGRGRRRFPFAILGSRQGLSVAPVVPDLDTFLQLGLRFPLAVSDEIA